METRARHLSAQVTKTTARGSISNAALANAMRRIHGGKATAAMILSSSIDVWRESPWWNRTPRDGTALLTVENL